MKSLLLLDADIVIDLLVSKKVDAVHDGEREALSFIYFHKDEPFRIALKDHAAIRAAVVLGVIEKAMSVEIMLKDIGVAIPKDSPLLYELTQVRQIGAK